MWISIALWLALVLPSLYVVQKYTGWQGVSAYGLLAALGVAWRARMPLPRSKRAIRWLGAGTFVLVLAGFLAVYPAVNVHEPGRGSDDDDAYDIGARALLAGRSPYAELTYLGNALHPLPGSFLVAVPFVLMGSSAWQNLFWLTVFFLAVRAGTSHERTALRLAWMVLALSPTVMHQVLTGTAHAANTIYVLLGLWWLIRTRHRAVAAVAWGVTLASRVNFLLLIPLAFGWLLARHGRRAAVRTTAITCLTVGAISLPFYVHGSARFGPLEGANRLLRFNAVVPYAGEVIVLLMSGLALVLSRRPMNEVALFRHCALVQAVPVVLGAVLGTLHRGRVDLAYVAYGTFAAWFVIMAAALSDER